MGTTIRGLRERVEITRSNGKIVILDGKNRVKIARTFGIDFVPVTERFADGSFRCYVLNVKEFDVESNWMVWTVATLLALLLFGLGFGLALLIGG